MSKIFGALSVDPRQLIDTFGMIGVLAIVFAESGLLFGFFLPGDSLLFTAGLLVSQGRLAPLWVVLLGCFVAAVAGDQVGFVLGRRFGTKLFNRPESRWFRRENVVRAERFFERHGPKTIVLARFVPVVRTFTPMLAGVGQMPYRRFVAYNVIGGLVWAVGVTMLGYTLGSTVPSIDRYLLPVIALIIALSAVPVLLELLRSRRAKDAASASDAP